MPSLLWGWYCALCDKQFWTNSTDDVPDRCPWCSESEQLKHSASVILRDY